MTPLAMGSKKAFPASERALAVEYAIRDVVAPARRLKQAGHQVLELNIGDPAAFDFPVPAHMAEAVAAAARQGGSRYSPSEGLPELRELVAAREKRRSGRDTAASDVHVATGVTEALHLLLSATLNPGDEVLVPGPSYPPYTTLVTLLGGRPVEYATDEEDGWQPDVDDLRARITPRTRAICLINPNNPTGALYGERVLRQVVDLAGEHAGQFFLVSDEIYDEMTFDGTHVPTAARAKDVPVVALNGFSKIFLVPGWRLGYAVFHDPDGPEGRLSSIRTAYEKLERNRLCPSTLAQAGGIAALKGPQTHVKATVDKLRRRRDLAWRRLNEIDGLSSAKPDGAFYIFPKIEALAQGRKAAWKDDKDFVLALLEEEKVLTVHGSGFGRTHGAGHFRVVILPPEATLTEAFDRIEAFVKRHS